MDNIVAEAKVSKSTIYNHYRGTEALFAATTERECHRVAAEMAVPAEVEGLALKADLESIARSYLTAILDRERIALNRMITAEAARFPALGKIFWESISAIGLSRIIAYIDNARAHGLLAAEDCEFAAVQFLALLRSDLHPRALLCLPVTADELDYSCEEAVKTFLARYAV